MLIYNILNQYIFFQKCDKQILQMWHKNRSAISNKNVKISY